jgi:hypothetical protein
MRISFSDEEEIPSQFALWQANCRRSLKGKRGQAALRELEAALLALPSKRLIAEEFSNADGDVLPHIDQPPHSRMSGNRLKPHLLSCERCFRANLSRLNFMIIQPLMAVRGTAM